MHDWNPSFFSEKAILPNNSSKKMRKIVVLAKLKLSPCDFLGSISTNKT
jgi:hypothetical protein